MNLLKRRMYYKKLPADSGIGMPAAFAPSRPPIPSEEFDQAELLAIEKEAIGLFLSAHPLKEVREALYAKVDRRLSELPTCKDGDWVTAGGIITQCKKIRTKSGDPMMFATLDDLEASVEILVFGNALSEYEGALGVDEVVPWQAERCIVVWTGPRGDKALGRWRSTAREAGKQSRRARHPVVGPWVSTEQLLDRVAGTRTLLLHEAATAPLASVPLPSAGDLLLVVGPEGGITERELAALTAAGGMPVRLGSSVVRTSTAGAAAVAVVSARTDRWA